MLSTGISMGTWSRFRFRMDFTLWKQHERRAMARPHAASALSLPYSFASRKSPRQALKPCSGCGFCSMMASASLAVSGPTLFAQLTILEGDHSAYRRCEAGMWSL